jgi:hypothetical protein
MPAIMPPNRRHGGGIFRSATAGATYRALAIINNMRPIQGAVDSGAKGKDTAAE